MPSISKQQLKQFVRRTVGEPYVGKRMKMFSLGKELDRLALAPQRILDAGSEDATFVYWLADRYPSAETLAVDVDVAAIEACRRARPARYAGRVEFEATLFADLPEQTFDLITAFDVLEHIEDDRAAAAALFNALRPGGTLLVHVPRDQWTRADGVVERVADDQAWRINPGHVRMGYSPGGLRGLLGGVGFEVDRTELWVRRWGVRAFAVYTRLEPLVPLRLLSLPVTDLCVRLDARRPEAEGNTVFAVARRPAA